MMMYFRQLTSADVKGVTKEVLLNGAEAWGLSKNDSLTKIRKAIVERMKNAVGLVGIPGNPMAHPVVVWDGPRGRVKLQFRDNRLWVPHAPEYAELLQFLWDNEYRPPPPEPEEIEMPDLGDPEMPELDPDAAPPPGDD